MFCIKFNSEFLRARCQPTETHNGKFFCIIGTTKPNQHLEGNQNRPKVQEITSLFVQPIFHFHDYRRKGKDAFCSSKEGRPLVKVDLLFVTPERYNLLPSDWGRFQRTCIFSWLWNGKGCVCGSFREVSKEVSKSGVGVECQPCCGMRDGYSGEPFLQLLSNGWPWRGPRRTSMVCGELRFVDVGRQPVMRVVPRLVECCATLGKRWMPAS